jgi:hypothetical protein
MGQYSDPVKCRGTEGRIELRNGEDSTIKTEKDGKGDKTKRRESKLSAGVYITTYATKKAYFVFHVRH